MMNKSQTALVEAFEKGYRVVDGSVISPKGRTISLVTDTNGYRKFSVKVAGERQHVPVHRLVGYEKYGKSLFEDDTCVRHLDGDCTNNKADNIRIGSYADNMQDIPAKIRVQKARKAAASKRKLTEQQVAQLRKDREEGATYPQLMSKYGIAKSTVSYIVNKKTY